LFFDSIKTSKKWLHLICGKIIDINSGGGAWGHHTECCKKNEYKDIFERKYIEQKVDKPNLISEYQVALDSIYEAQREQNRIIFSTEGLPTSLRMKFINNEIYQFNSIFGDW
jgi:hypothetical protein